PRSVPAPPARLWRHHPLRRLDGRVGKRHRLADRNGLTPRRIGRAREGHKKRAPRAAEPFSAVGTASQMSSPSAPWTLPLSCWALPFTSCSRPSARVSASPLCCFTLPAASLTLPLIFSVSSPMDFLLHIAGLV